MSLLVSSILGNSQKLDGGAMFGNAPKALWSRWVQADEQNRIDLATRALLVETGPHKLLFETGIGAYMEPKYRERYGVQEDQHVLLESLAQLELAPKDITDIVLSHLHFDHAGGLLSAWQADRPPELLFPNATYYVGETAWERALQPHPRDQASFVPSLNEQLAASQRLKMVSEGEVLSFPELDVHFFQSDGHTPGMLCSDLRWNHGRLVFAADLIPGQFWVNLPITMGYDRFPEQLINEKQKLLTSVVADDAWVFYTHDTEIAFSKVVFDEDTRKFVVGERRSQLERMAL